MKNIICLVQEEIVAICKLKPLFSTIATSKFKIAKETTSESGRRDPAVVESEMEIVLSVHGHVTIGTPCHTLSRVEFQPQWDTNAPVAWWARISTCGAHPHTFPLFLVLSANPGGKIGSKLVKSLARSELVKDHGRRMDHKNLWPLLSSAVAIWCICGASNPPWLPKQRNTTDDGGCSESQLMISSFPACSF
nr:unknown [Ipomoea trifida]